MKTLICAAVSATLVLPAFAQERGRTTSGEEVRLGWIGSVGAGCKANPVPSIKPARVAEHGQIRLSQGEVKTNSVPNCPGITIPAIVVFYKSSPDFKGEDGFSLTVEGSGTATSERTYIVTVE